TEFVARMNSSVQPGPSSRNDWGEVTQQVTTTTKLVSRQQWRRSQASRLHPQYLPASRPMISDVGVWSGALSASDVANLFANPFRCSRARLRLACGRRPARPRRVAQSARAPYSRFLDGL